VRDYLLDFIEHSISSPNKEVCGLVINDKYYRCNNISEDPYNFILDPSDYIKYSSIGKVALVCHSHLGISCEPTQADIYSCNSGTTSWAICSAVSKEVRYLEPNSMIVPLLGRRYSFGTTDCWGLISDVLKYEMNIKVDRLLITTKEWYKMGLNILEENSEEYGFKKIKFSEAKKYDIILFKSGKSNVPNHVGILHDNGTFLHHCENRLSTRDAFGGYWNKCAVAVYRHKDLE